MNSMHKPERASKAHLHRRLRVTATTLLLAFTALVTILGLVFPSLTQAEPSVPAPIYVKWDAEGLGNGTSWDDAYTDLQTAIDDSVGVDIWVAAGVYYPPTAGLADPREATFNLKGGVEVYGGFAGDETSLNERDWQTNVTVLSGDLLRNDVDIDEHGVVLVPNGDSVDNCYHVVTADELVALSAQFNGFYITGGVANLADPELGHDRGAGIYNYDGATPKLIHLIVQGNWALNEGGGMYNDGGGPNFTNVTFRSNYAGVSGGGFSTRGSAADIANLNFHYNEAGVSGGGMFLHTTDGQTLTNLTFIENTAISGGGLYVRSSDGHSSLSGSTFNENTAVDGGGLYIDESDFSLRSSAFTGNEASDQGGGIFAQLSLEGTTYSLSGLTLTDNHAVTSGGGLYSYRSKVSLSGSTLIANSAALGGGAYVEDHAATGTKLEVESNTEFLANVASEDGGGLYVVDSPRGSLSSVTFEGNQASDEGGGMYLRTSGGIVRYTVSSVNFGGNHAESGGGLYVYESDPELANVSFDGNQAQLTYVDDSIGGGGLYLYGSSDAKLSRCTFTENTAATGGGMYIDDGNPTLTNVAFLGNEAGDGVAAGSGGGLWNGEGSPTLKDVLFSGNAATLHGGGMYSYSGDEIEDSVDLTNLTFTGNNAMTGFGGGLYTTSPNVAIHNTVVWNNQDSSGDDTASASIWDVPDAAIDHSLIHYQTPAGVGNLSGTDPDNDPQFVVPVDPATAPTTAGILSVKYGSPIVDMGDNMAIAGVTLDLASNPRIYNDTVDLGPYELQLACPSPTTTRLYVDRTANLGNTGENWLNALKNLRDAFTLADDCAGIDEIWVADGVYRPDEGVGLIPDDRFETYPLVDGVAVYGGFDGGEGSLNLRDWLSFPAVLSGDVDSNDTATSGVVQDPDDIAGANSYHVVTADSVGSTTVLDGFTITAGQASGSELDLTDRGGGLHNKASSLVLANLRFIGNYAVNGGALANLDGSDSVLTSIQFEHNDAATAGGAVYNLASSPTLTGTVLSYNSASDGGAIYNLESSPTLTHTLLSYNSGSNGGAIYNMDSSPTFTGTVLVRNAASSAGGAIYNLTSSPILTNTVLSANRATNGAALYNNGSGPSLIQAQVSGNSATGNGGAIYNTASSPILVSVTVAGNRATAVAGGMFNANTSLPVVRNSIFWDSRDATGTGTARATIHNADSGSLPAIDYSLVQSLSGIAHTGSHNTDRNPWFTTRLDPALAPSTAGDFTLGIFSLAIDVGNSAFTPLALGHDLAGNDRLINGTIDMGAYEAPFRTVYDVYLPVVVRNYP